MPPHTPEYNPDEYLNNDLKGNVHEAGLPGDKEELRSGVQRFMRRLFSAAGACHELLSASLCTVRGRHMIYENLIRQGNMATTPSMTTA